MTQTIVNLGTGGAALNGQNGSTSSADSNDARFLEWPGDNAGNYVYQPGLGNNYMSVPDEAALDITDEIDIRLHVALEDWASGSRQTIFSKWLASGNNRSWLINVESTGIIGFQYTATGSAGGANYLSTVAPTVSNGGDLWIRVTWIRDNGSGLSEANHYTSTDGSTWVALGSTITSAITTAIYSGTGDIQFSSFNFSNYKIYRAQILDGIGGTTVLDVDTSVITSGAATSFTALTGQTVTIKRGTAGRKSVAVVSPVWLFGTDDYMEVADNALIDLDDSTSMTALVVIRQWATPVNGGYYLDKRVSTGYALLNFAGSLQIRIFLDDGPSLYGIQGSAFDAGSLVTFAGVIDRTTDTTFVSTNGIASSGVDISAAGSFSSSGVNLTIGKGVYQDFELIAVSVFRRALTATEITQILDYYQARLS